MTRRFPNQRRNSGARVGDPLGYRVQLLRQRQLSCNASARCWLHNFWHFIAAQLCQGGSLREQVRKDIWGHAGTSINAESHNKMMRVSRLSNAISTR